MVVNVLSYFLKTVCKKLIKTLCSDALNSLTADREDYSLNDVDKDCVERLNNQLINERMIHQQIISGLQQQLADATTVRNLQKMIVIIVDLV